MHTLVIDQATHRYSVNGKRYPSVTQIIQDSGYSNGEEHYYTSDSRRQGTAVHLATHYADIYAPDALNLDELLEKVDIDERLHGYVAGWLAFKRETGFRT